MGEQSSISQSVKTVDQKVDGIVPALFRSWKTLPFIDCIEQTPGIKRKLKKSEIKSDGKIPVVDQGESFITGYTDNEKDIYNASLPLIVFGDHTRHIKYVDFSFAVGADGTKIIIPKRFFDTKYFFNYLNALKWQHNGYGRNYKYLKQIIVPLPPLNEQKRVVAKLDAIITRIDSVKARLDKVPILIKRFRQSVLTAAVTGKLTEKWRMEHPDVKSAEVSVKSIYDRRIKECKTTSQKKKVEGFFSEVETEDNSLIPETWLFIYLNKICESFQYGTSSKSSKTGKVAVLRMGNLQNGKIDWSNLAYTSDMVEIKKYRLEKNTVLFNRTNSPELVGKTSIYLGEQEAIFAGYLIKVNNFEILDSHYLNFALNTNYAKAFCSREKTDGVSQSNINAQKLGRFEIPLPPLAEQKEIVRQVDKLFTLADKLETHYQNAKARIDKLSQSVLAKAFRGELVPQDPNDEPAEKLLERIMKEKTKMEGSLKLARKKTRGKRGKK